MRFLSYFDMNYNRKPFHIKNLHSFYRNNQEIINESINRLKGIFKLFGQKFFIEYNILYLTNYQYVNFDYREKTKYLIYIFQKLNSILDNVINIYKLYILTHKQLKNMINPNFTKCLIIKESEDENSITDSDVSFLIEN